MVVVLRTVKTYRSIRNILASSVVIRLNCRYQADYNSYPHPVRYTHPEIPIEVFFANPRFADFGVLAGVCGGSYLRGTG